MEGDGFQAEVAARLKSVNVSFMTVPPHPSGDGGLDGISHNGERAYCCYGQEHDAAATDRARASKIIQKFTNDLRRLFELTTSGSTLVHRDNPALATIIGTTRIKHIELITNWYRSHEISGPLLTEFARCKRASRCRFVDPNATLAISGPMQLANDYGVDEIALIRIQQRDFAVRLQAAADTVTIDAAPDFDEKIATLKSIAGPTLSHSIEMLASRLRTQWGLALAFEHELDQTVPAHHEALQRSRKRIETAAIEAQLALDEPPWSVLAKTREVAVKVLEGEFGSIYGTVVDDVAPGEVARLIGKCTIDWEEPREIPHG